MIWFCRHRKCNAWCEFPCVLFKRHDRKRLLTALTFIRPPKAWPFVTTEVDLLASMAGPFLKKC
eukprot:2401134-Amphidinium_carterae.1